MKNHVKTTLHSSVLIYLSFRDRDIMIVFNDLTINMAIFGKPNRDDMDKTQISVI